MKLKLFTTIILIFALSNNTNAQDKPKLVVGIVVDQMRYDLLNRFSHNFSDKGLKRLMNDGFFAENMHYNYAPTYTGPGHSSIYTGSIPALNGIAANNWYENGIKMYCTQDDSVHGLSSDSKKEKMSPKNLKSTTVTDQLYLATNRKSKVVSISLKDRGAILPGGHTSKNVFWYNSDIGEWVSSSFYMNSLPEWLKKFNTNHPPSSLMKNGWDLTLSPQSYSLLNVDNVSWERSIKDQNAIFPYKFEESEYNKLLPATSHGNTLTSMLAIEALNAYNLGHNEVTDFLAVSFSSTDYVGHSYGPYSLEIEDAYYSLDIAVGKLMDELDKKVGKGNYIVFMTGDHGVQDVPEFSLSHNIPAGRIHYDKLKDELEGYLNAKFGTKSLIQKIYNSQIYLDKSELKSKNLNVKEVAEYLNEFEHKNEYGIRAMVDFESMESSYIVPAIKKILMNGYYKGRSGDISILLEPNWLDDYNATSHGTPYNHDTHVPFLLYGMGIKPQSSSVRYDITDIAPTISYILGILQPNACIGNPISELDYIKNK